MKTDVRPSLIGVIPSLITPFDEELQIAWTDITKVIRFQLNNGARSFLALGIGGEVNQLSAAERMRVAELVLSAVPRDVSVIIGVSANDVRASCEFTEHAVHHGAAAVMAAPPELANSDSKKLHEYFISICDAAGDTSVVVQDASAFFGHPLEMSFINDLVAARDNVRFVKPESHPVAERTAELVESFGARLGILGGMGGLYFMDVLEAGAVAVIPGCEATAQFIAIYEALVAGDRETAIGRFSRLLPLLVFENETLDIFLASSKAILKSLGVIQSDASRASNSLGPYARKALARHASSAGIGFETAQRS